MRSTRPSFNILICGAGIGGLGAAIALAQHGHKVVVFESASALSEIGAGIQIPPNSSRILQAYGLKDKLQEKVVSPADFIFRRYASGEVIGRTEFGDVVVKKYGYPYWLIHRAEYQRILYNAAVAAGVLVKTNSRVQSVTHSPTSPSVSLTDNSTYTADLIIGADGIRSKVRASMFPDIMPDTNHNTSYRATVPRETMLASPTIQHLMSDVNANIWIGPNRHIMAYPIASGSLYNLVLNHPAPASSSGSVGQWNEVGDIGEMHAYYEAFDPVINEVVSHVKECLRWKIADLPILPHWISEHGNVVLLGDAAHAMTPFLAQGAAQTIEDGAVLTECLDRAKDAGQICRCMESYERIRKGRAERVQSASREVSRIWHLEDGESQNERDGEMTRSMMAQEDRRQKEDGCDESEGNPTIGPDPNTIFGPWLFAHDAIQAARNTLDEAFGRQT